MPGLRPGKEGVSDGKTTARVSMHVLRALKSCGDLMMAMSKEEYISRIPSCCEYQTVYEHIKEMLLCCGITNRLVSQEKFTHCRGCECNTHSEAVAAGDADSC